MKKLLASDLDGTLILKDVMSKKDVNSIKKFKDNGGVFIISTGRPLNGVINIEIDNKIEVDYFVLLNGAYIANSKREVIRQLFIDSDVVNKIIDKISKKGIKPAVDTGEATYIFEEEIDFPFPNVKVVKSFDELEHKPSFIAMNLEGMSSEEMDNFKDEIIEEFGEYISVYRNTKYVDIVPKGCSKGDGVKFISEVMDIESKDIYTIGDSYNDIAMFDITNNSFTFDRAEYGVKKFAKNIVKDVSECIEEFIFN